MEIRDPRTGKTYVRKRRERFEQERTPRELTFTCFHRFPFLARDRSRLWFIEAISKYRKEFAIDLWAWVVMPEHVHLLVSPRIPDVPVGRFVGRVKEDVARKGIAWLTENAPSGSPKLQSLKVNRIDDGFGSQAEAMTVISNR